MGFDRSAVPLKRRWNGRRYIDKLIKASSPCLLVAIRSRAITISMNHGRRDKSKRRCCAEYWHANSVLFHQDEAAPGHRLEGCSF